jgi:hypothetical protein
VFHQIVDVVDLGEQFPLQLFDSYFAVNRSEAWRRALGDLFDAGGKRKGLCLSHSILVTIIFKDSIARYKIREDYK